MALLAGAVAITISTLMYKQSRSKHLVAHLSFIVWVNLIVLVNLAMLYFYQNLSSQVSATTVSMIDDLYQIMMPGLQIAAVLSLYRLSRLLLGIESLRMRKKAIVWFPLAAILLQVMLALWRPTVSTTPILYLVYKATEGITLVTAYGIICTLLWCAGQVRPQAKVKPVRAYSTMLASILTVAIVASALTGLEQVTTQTFTIAAAVLALLANLVPVLYYQKFLVPRFVADDSDSGELISAERLQTQFDITSREREVLMLVCEGRTNQEIADRLFISLQTVKDHVSRIYRKTGVRNRVQLISLLKESEKPPISDDGRE